MASCVVRVPWSAAATWSRFPLALVSNSLADQTERASPVGAEAGEASSTGTGKTRHPMTVINPQAAPAASSVCATPIR